MRLTIISNARNKPIYTCLAEVNIALDAKYVNRAINVVMGNVKILFFCNLYILTLSNSSRLT